MTIFKKQIDIERAESSTQTVVGVVMEPNVVDSMGDFERPETIEALSQDFMERLAAGDAKNGVMHAVFNDDITHVENRVLESTEKIGTTTYPRGTWEIGVKIHDDRLWQLIDERGLTGFSIGGEIHKSRTYPLSELPANVRVEDHHDSVAEHGFREIQDGRIEEISIVDQPAVPSAQIQVAKRGRKVAKAADPALLKANDALTESVDAAFEVLRQRGHDRDNARQLAEYLNQDEYTDKRMDEPPDTYRGLAPYPREKRTLKKATGTLEMNVGELQAEMDELQANLEALQDNQEKMLNAKGESQQADITTGRRSRVSDPNDIWDPFK